MADTFSNAFDLFGSSLEFFTTLPLAHCQVAAHINESGEILTLVMVDGSTPLGYNARTKLAREIERLLRST